MTLHKEGYGTLTVVLLLEAAIFYSLFMLVPLPNWFFWVLGIGLGVFFLLCVQFFRLPRLRLDPEEGVVYAPADGKVVVIEPTTEGELLKDERIQISIFMSPLNVHVNRMPLKATVRDIIYHPGKYLVAWHPKSSTENERTTLLLETAEGVSLVMRQIAGAVARRIRWYVKPGEELQAGQEFGFIKFGSRVDVFLPTDAEIVTHIGEVSRAGKTVLARLAKT